MIHYKCCVYKNIVTIYKCSCYSGICVSVECISILHQIKIAGSKIYVYINYPCTF